MRGTVADFVPDWSEGPQQMLQNERTFRSISVMESVEKSGCKRPHTEN
jgi:hypothetical protein